jgi:hypothetical protein
MKLIEVTTPAHQKEFIEMAVQLYKNEKNWIQPLDVDIEGGMLLAKFRTSI